MAIALSGLDGLSNASIDSQIVVKTASQLTGTLDSTKLYVIDGVIDMGDGQITVPQGGLVLSGLNMSLSGLTTSEPSHTLFIDDGVYSGSLYMSEMFITVSGAGSQVFDLDNAGNFGSVELARFNFQSCTSLGIQDNYRQGLWENVGLIACTDGLTMEGTWAGGIAIVTSIVISAGTAFTGTVLKKGSALVVNGSVRSDINALQIDDTGAVCDFEPANISSDDQFRMTGVRVNSASTAFPNMPVSSTKAKFVNCVGTDNSYIGGQWKITTETETVIASADTPVKMAGTSTYYDLQWFSGPSDNAITYDSDQKIEVQINAVLSMAGGNGDQINLITRQWDNSASSFVDLSESGPATMSQSGRSNPIPILAYAVMEKNDRIEVWVENQSDSSNVTCKVGGLVSISERAA